MSDTVLVDVNDAIATITLNRPESLNAMSTELLGALVERSREVAEDSAVRAVVLTGAGRAFCAGGDISGMRERQPGTGKGGGSGLTDNASRLRRQEETSVLLAEMPKPTVAAINGAAAGAGMSIALACDFRIMAESARIVPAFARIGFSGDFGGSWFLQRLVGPARAKAIYMLSEPIDAAQALSEGIVNRVVPAESVMDEAMALARRLAAGPTVAYGQMKRNFAIGASGTLGEVLDAEAEGMTMTGQTDDHRAAAMAFLQKQEPIFRGR